MTRNNAQASLDYLNLTISYRRLSSSILNILIEDSRITHAERINNSRNLVILHAGDIVMVRVAIQSDVFKKKGDKLNYSVRDPCQIIRNTGFGSYFVRKLNKPDSPELKFMAYNLYPLPPSLNPCKPIDSNDTQYLNQTHAPLVNRLKGLFALNYIIRNGLINQL